MITPKDYETYKKEIEEAQNDELTSMLTPEQIIESVKEANEYVNQAVNATIENPFNTPEYKISPNEVIDSSSLEVTGKLTIKLRIEEEISKEYAMFYGLQSIQYERRKKSKYCEYCKHKYLLFIEKPRKNYWFVMDQYDLFIVKDIYEECEDYIFPKNYDEIEDKEFIYPRDSDMYYIYEKIKMRLEECADQVTKQIKKEYLRKGKAILDKIEMADQIIEKQKETEEAAKKQEEEDWEE